MKLFKDTKKLVLLGVLSALGSIFMLIEIPYPPVPFLKFDISDLPVLLTAQALGLWPAIFVSVIKSLISLMVRGMNSPMGIGLITAAISSIALAYLYVSIKKYVSGTKWYEKVIRFVGIIFTYSVFMTICNYVFITPIYLGGLWFTDVADWVTLEAFIPNLTFSFFNLSFTIPNFGYGATIAFIYMPFNSLKGFFILSIYEAISSRLLPELKKILKNS